jgi:hypothetical protein
MHPNYWVALGCCELFALLANSEVLRVLFKRPDQRSGGERQRVKNGLGRSLLLELVLFVPATSALTWTLTPIVPAEIAIRLGEAYAPLLGIVSYGFPFRAVRAVVERMALATLRGFAAAIDRDVASETLEEGPSNIHDPDPHVSPEKNVATPATRTRPVPR